ncbi:NUDIX hydrolase [Streptomyces canus]|uniref:NUDIX hydrolase n=1 Tax=Streptomyces canus TaxID=58343 RepID=UPI002E25BAA4
MKRDYLNESDAPRANRLWPVVNVAVFGPHGLLLIERADDGYWAMPGGMVDVGEGFTEAAVREVREETGLEVTITGLVGLYSDPGHVTAFDDGTVSQECSIVFRGREVGGTIRTSDESRSVRYVPLPETAPLIMHPSMRLRVGHAVMESHVPYLG